MIAVAAGTTPGPLTARGPLPRGPLLIVEERHDLPLARLTVTLRSGAAEDPPGLEGLAQFAAELTRRGAGTLDRQALDDRFDALGADLSVSVGFDSITWDVEVLSAKLEPALALLADVILRPRLDEREAAQLRREMEADLDELEEDDPQLARRFFVRALHGDAGYGRPVGGTRASLARLDVEQARRLLERAISAAGLIIGAAGDVDPARFAASIERRFGVLRPGAAARPPLPAPTGPRAERVQRLQRTERPGRTSRSNAAPAGRGGVTLVDKPERTQTQILLGQPGVAWSDPDFFPLLVATNAFGGTFTARLMTEVRVKRGLSYGCSARLGQGRRARALQVYLYPAIERTGEALALVLDLWRGWVENGISDAELRFSRDNLAGSVVLERVTPEDRLDLRVALELCGMPADYAATTAARIRAVTADDVRHAMARHLRPDGLTITLLTTAARLGDQLAHALPQALRDTLLHVAHDAF